MQDSSNFKMSWLAWEAYDETWYYADAEKI